MFCGDESVERKQHLLAAAMLFAVDSYRAKPEVFVDAGYGLRLGEI